MPRCCGDVGSWDEPVGPIIAARPYPEREIVVERRIVTPEPVVVERTYVVNPPYAYAVREADPVKRLNPETGHYIGQGLFNRTGPNDFGG